MPGWDLDRSLGQALTGSSGEGAAGGNTAVEAVERLLESIDASINFDTWPWSLEGFKMAVGDFSSTGAGTYDPEAGAVELQLQALLTPERSAELVAKNSELRYLMDDGGRLTLPLKLSGELTSPRVEVELDDLLAQALDRERDKLEDDLEEKAKEKLGGLLDSLLGKKKDDD